MTLSKEIAGLDEDISVWEGDKRASTEVRELEDALERAIAVLKKQAYDRSQDALMQVKGAKFIPDSAKKVISAFLAQGAELGEDPMSVSAPEANAYEFQSSGIVDMLEKLHDKFEDERTDLEKEE